MKNKEKIVRDLVNTFNERDELHAEYKARMKIILLDFYYDSAYADPEFATREDLISFIENFVETRFKPSKE